MTDTQVILIRKNNITALVVAEGTMDISPVEVERLPTTQQMLPNWLADIYYSLTQQIEQLEEAMRLAVQHNWQLDIDYPGLITRYHGLIAYQNHLYHNVSPGLEDIDATQRAQYEQMKIDSSEFTTHVQGGIRCLEEESSNSYNRLRAEWLAHLKEVDALITCLTPMSGEREIETNKVRKELCDQLSTLKIQIRKERRDQRTETDNLCYRMQARKED